MLPPPLPLSSASIFCICVGPSPSLHAAAPSTLLPIFPARLFGLRSVVSSKQNCMLCSDKSGSCIQCSHPKCFDSWHVTCAREAQLLGSMKTSSEDGEATDSVLQAFCKRHIPVCIWACVSRVQEQRKVEVLIHLASFRIPLVGLGAHPRPCLPGGCRPECKDQEISASLCKDVPSSSSPRPGQNLGFGHPLPRPRSRSHEEARGCREDCQVLES